MNATNIIIVIAAIVLFTIACWYTNKALIEKRQELKQIIRENYIITSPQIFHHWIEIKSISELNDEIDRFKSNEPLPEHFSKFIRLKPTL